MMRMWRLLCWAKCKIADLLSDLKNGCSPEIRQCIAGVGVVENGARVFTKFPRTIAIGKSVKIGRGTVISNYDKSGLVEIGDGTSVGWYNNFYAMAGIRIGRNVLFASNVCILTANHGWRERDVPIKDQSCTYAPVSIGDDSWIGYNVIILPGVNIGRHVVVGAGSVVTHDLPDYSVCAGAPCRVIRAIA